MNYGQYLVPLLIGKKQGHNHYTLDRYAGVAFYINKKGTLATCKHIVESVNSDEVLLGKNLASNEIDIISDITKHPDKDFAICQFNKCNQSQTFRLDNTVFSPGEDLQAFGFTSNGKNGANVKVDARLFKGYIVRTSDKPLTSDSNSTLEISFPSHKGFSGAPIVNTRNVLVGMLFSNYESTIEQHSFTEVDDEGNKFKESIHKVFELGIAHSNLDIKKFLADLGIS